MSIKSTAPLRVAGATLDTTDVGDGAQSWTQGGQETYTSFSGVNAATLVVSGPGRLNKTFVTAQLISGQSVVFVDSATATSGMPFSTSGHKIVGLIPPVWRVGASGNLTLASQEGNPIEWGVPFFSGLCACPLASGTPGFGLTWTFGLNPTLSGTSPPN